MKAASADKGLLPQEKPLLRGYIHQQAFFISLGACLLLICKSSSRSSLIASLVYSFGLLMLFGISAFYHRIHWQKKTRNVLKRLDHSAIFLLIAGTVTPVAMLSLSKKEGRTLLIIIWVVALIGVLKSIFWLNAPKWLSAAFYVLTGWLVVPYLHLLSVSLGVSGVRLLLAGGIMYTVGALFYAFKKPNLIKGVFGYHELFHLFTVIGACLHFIVIYRTI